MVAEIKSIVSSRHPSFLAQQTDWEKWRRTYEGGVSFRKYYLEKFDKREAQEDFDQRLKLTPIPSFAKAAVNDIWKSIFQRLNDVTRVGGSDNYQKAVAGEQLGVDLHGSTMNYFLGNKLLTELLIMGKVGVYVDMPELRAGPSLAEVGNAHPYLYHYVVEDILNYNAGQPEDPSEFKAIMLRDVVMNYDQFTYLPTGYEERYRRVWINQETGYVNIQFYTPAGEPIDRQGNPSGPVELNIRRIPFVIFDIGSSLLTDVSEYQIALLNLISSDVNYALKSNFPFYVEQRDGRDVGKHLKPAGAEGTATTGGQGAKDEKVEVGASHGRYYQLGMERPGFIAPPSEPLEASMKLQDRLEAQIRKLVNLAVTNLSTRASAESKEMDNQGLDAGLSFIGSTLERGERRIADFWAAYENSNPQKRRVALVKYPDKYSLKTDADRISEAEKLSELIFKTPSRKAKREIHKHVVSILLGGRVKQDTLKAIHQEIDDSPFVTSDPDTIKLAKDAGLCGDKTASMALGFDDEEYLVAREDHIARVERIAQAQGVLGSGTGDPASRGVKDLSANDSAGSEEKELSRQTDTNESTKTPVRGEAD